MSLSSFEFVIFFAVVLLGRSLLRNLTAEKWFLILASCAFYVSWNAPCVLLILLTSITDYWIGRRMGQTTDAGARRKLLFASLAFNLGLLGFFKYSNFFLANVCAVLNALGLKVGSLHYNIILPPAISYFTFASISYVIDVYYERIPACRSARDYTLFLTFFPKLLSGPIVRAREFLPQLKERVRPTAADIEIGCSYFLLGLVKKLAIADQVAGHVNLIFSTPGQYDGLTLLLGALGYTVQIYCDFSGYSDMAIGCARLMGYQFPENFQLPFSAASITEFWRRWHITLSQWFRDYLFLPLEMATRASPHPTLRVALNMMATMLLCGLWHGASWNFVIWGGIHGVALTVHKIWTTWNRSPNLKRQPTARLLSGVLSHLSTLGVIVLSMIFFRAESVSAAFTYVGRLASWSHGMRLGSPYIPAGILVVILMHLLIHKDRNVARELPTMALPIRVFAYSSLLLALVLLGATDSAPFIYFQF